MHLSQVFFFLISTSCAFSFLLSVGAEELGDPNPAYVCSACVLLLGLVEQTAFQIKLERALQAQCTTEDCDVAVHELVVALEAKAVPEEICRQMALCNDNCVAFVEWPVDPLPNEPIEWPIERKASSVNLYPVGQILKTLVMNTDIGNVISPIGHAATAMGRLFGAFGESECARNFTCKIDAFVNDHKPLQDHDGDSFATKQAKRLRGSHWRGYDCDDTKDDVYPGRLKNNYDDDIDHNCNGIWGGNETGSYEDIFCANYQPRGLVILGDSATAHFHIPPQWVTAQGWNFDQLLPDAMNELDMPMCSWGTGHVTPEECPYQHPVPGVDGVVSLYTQLRERNRCVHNDFQNIGVNGARITSSMKLVNSLARDPTLDQPVTLWLALIGNDVCNGHPDFTHMTKPEEFYSSAMESLTALDNILPTGSHVIALALFDGELLYTTMHTLQHPVGTTYDGIYEFMNCEEENPCWGWLNANQTIRRISTAWSNKLNDVYQNISDTQAFKNFKFIFYSPQWAEIFQDYAKSGNPLSNLIEPVDGFHPSQAGNAVFAQKFFEFLENEHPETLPPVNPYNSEIDALFFS